MAAGLGLQAVGLAWIAAVSTATVGYSSLVLPFVLSGIGMGLFFAPVANVVLSAVRPEQEGKASGANNAIREVGGVLGVAVLASIFARVRRVRVAGRPSTTGSCLRSGSARWSSASGARARAPHPAQAASGARWSAAEPERLVAEAEAA